MNSLSKSLAVPNSRGPSLSNLALQLQHRIHQCLRRRWATRHVYIDGHDAVAATNDAVAVVIIPAAVRTAAHADDPARLRHLVVDLPQRGRHLVGHRTRDDQDVGLARRGSEESSQPVLVVSWGGEVHHFDGAAREAEGHGP